MAGTSLGMIETRGYTAAICGADAGMKAANVEFLGYAHTSPALITIRFQGDVGAVKAAVEAATAAAAAVGQVVAKLIIARPDRQLSGILRGAPPAPSSPVSTEEPESLPQPAPPADQPAPTTVDLTEAQTLPPPQRPAPRKKRAATRQTRTGRQKTATASAPAHETPATPAPTLRPKARGENNQKS